MIAIKPAITKSPMPLIRPALLLTVLFFLSACSVLPKREPARIYEPAHAVTAADAAWPMANWSLIVATPSASQQLDSDRITVRPAPGALQVYKDASWSDSVPHLVQSALLRQFEDSQKITAVARPGDGIQGDYQLLTDLRAFESVYVQPGQPQVVIEVYARLVHTVDGKVVMARAFKQTEDSASEDVGAVVEAFSRALDRLSGQVVGWTLDSGNQHHAGPAIRSE